MTKALNHVAIIMDGNGRWAKKRFLPRKAGHVAGVKATKKAVQFCVINKIKSLTIYAFSNENWNRPKVETDHLMGLFIQSLKNEIVELHSNQIKITFIGNRSDLSVKLNVEISNAEKLTKDNLGLKLNIALNYGGRSEILNAIKSLDLKQVDIQALTEEKLADYMYLPNQENVDLLIRTGGEQRISNFLLWHIAYAELYFSDVLWPDFDAKEFEHAISVFNNTERRFGKTSEQLKKC